MINTPAIDTSLCPEHLGGRCTRCQAACPTGAVSLHGEPAIAADLCRNCGACASVCPTGALAHLAAVSLSLGLSNYEGGKAPALRCPKAGQCDRDELPVAGCLSSLGLETLLGLWLHKKATVRFITGNCSACRAGDGGRTFRAGLGQAEDILAHSQYAPEIPFTVETRTEKAPLQRDNDVSLSRRGFLGLLTGSKSASSPKDSLKDKRVVNKRMVLACYLKVLKAQGPIPEGMVSGTIRGEGNCTACGACANACPTGAMTLTGEGVRTLEFTPAFCVACGACVEVCLPRFLHEAPSNLESLSSTPDTLFHGSVGTCKRCNAHTAIIDDDNGYCPVCRHKMRMMDEQG